MHAHSANDTDRMNRTDRKQVVNNKQQINKTKLNFLVTQALLEILLGIKEINRACDKYRPVQNLND